MRARQLRVVVISLLFIVAGVPSFSTSASAAQTLITCTDSSTGKISILASSNKNCLQYQGQAMWQERQPTSGAVLSENVKVINICSSLREKYKYQIIKDSCAKYQRSQQYAREVIAPPTPVIQSIYMRPGNGVTLVLDLTINHQLGAAPIAYYRVTNQKTEKVSYVIADRAGRLNIEGLTPQSTYTFRVVAVNVDGVSAQSESTPEIQLTEVEPDKTPATPPVRFAVGDRGPGGGIIFYVSQTSFTSPGSACDPSCNYLEVAPSTWKSGVIAEDDIYVWSNNTVILTGQDTTTPSAQGRLVDRAFERANWRIGAGLYNTRVMKVAGAQSDAQAAVLAFAGTDASAGQWFIPSLNELNELCKFARGQATGDLSVACTSGGAINTSLSIGADAAGFVEGIYWSSSERDAGRAWLQQFYNGYGSRSSFKYYDVYIRPIRAF